MNYIASYSLLFTDSLFANTIFYGGTEMALYVMKEFGGYDKRIMFTLALLGYAGSVVINYWFGRILYKIYDSSIDNKDAAENYKSLTLALSKYGYIILALNIVPAIGPFTPVLASFVNSGLKRTLGITLLYRIVYYAVILWII